MVIPEGIPNCPPEGTSIWDMSPLNGGFLKWGYPRNHPFHFRVFHEITHPAIGIPTVVGKGSRLSLGLRSPGADPATEKSAGVAGSTYWVCKVVPFLVCFILLKLNMCVCIFFPNA